MHHSCILIICSILEWHDPYFSALSANFRFSGANSNCYQGLNLPMLRLHSSEAQEF